ncbi:AcrR family transcriptional regulator [Nocardiopsis mwathae]|uniref:AcrR family transcriptional regulator n=1 Tax=Nocardiopsis mwathae TaxID=1472723 RepID=A0A7W9YFF3_9ACTN|nr:TetR/AcrR family transcriptional regulator [Nocardiopsis mwathae]MBB6170276.1 AcrR family transcriptional regulator [Nocardiopsis mwathae]
MLAGAKRCLYEKGYARTTARDIVAASNTNLASIGYHFGSKEALLNEALIQACTEWYEELERALVVELDPTTGAVDRFETVWSRIVELFEQHRSLWIANFEALAQIERAPEVRRILAESQQSVRDAMASWFPDQGAAGDEMPPPEVGALLQAMLMGVMAQWLIDPESAPGGRDLAIGLRRIGTGIGPLRGTPHGG